VVLTGANEDGSRGLQCVDEFGGYCVVQDPGTAAVPTMPAAALKRVPRAAVLPLAGIAAHIVDVAKNGPPAEFKRATA
jgi:two-component system chemotaxis response regulator CheB